HMKDLLAVLDRGDSPAGETRTVATAVDEVDDRRIEVPTPQEIGMQRMRDAPGFHGAIRGPQPLPQHLAAKYLRAADVAAHTAEQIDLELLEFEHTQQL